MAEIEGGRRVEVPEVERVRTFVKFEKQESAVRVRISTHTYIHTCINSYSIMQCSALMRIDSPS